jgi:hypothetical protein
MLLAQLSASHFIYPAIAMTTSILPKNAVTCKMLGDGWRLNYLYSRFATVTRPDGSRHCAYFGFDDLETASAYLQLVAGFPAWVNLSESSCLPGLPSSVTKMAQVFLV